MPALKARAETTCQPTVAGKAVNKIITVPKKQKTPKKSVAAANGDRAETPAVAAKNQPQAPAKAQKTAAKSPPRKSPAPRAAKVRKTAARPRRVAEPTAEQIQLRAYFISEHRQRHGAPGDHHSDWLEARRQLLIEAQKNN
jgi:hypothetical protein